MCNKCEDPEQAQARHSLSRRERLRNDPDYGDYMYEQVRDRKMEEEADREQRPPADRAILKALFDTIPVVFAKEENRGWAGLSRRGLKKTEMENE